MAVEFLDPSRFAVGFSSGVVALYKTESQSHKPFKVFKVDGLSSEIYGMQLQYVNKTLVMHFKYQAVKEGLISSLEANIMMLSFFDESKPVQTLLSEIGEVKDLVLSAAGMFCLQT